MNLREEAQEVVEGKRLWKKVGGRKMVGRKYVSIFKISTRLKRATVFKVIKLNSGSAMTQYQTVNLNYMTPPLLEARRIALYSCKL